MINIYFLPQRHRDTEFTEECYTIFNIQYGHSQMNIQHVIKSAKQLSAKDKAFVAHCLILSLETQSDKNVDQAWGELAQQRYGDLVSGNTTALSWQEIKDSLNN